ncbi:MAG TPA: phenylalanine--tRNA ligase subunit beta [Methylophilaceae bacterium]|nr:phenylalanine--tRNA ligase subunit beta [Methylophilaceae bacterium]
MQFNEKWLRTFVNPSLNSDALAHALTMAGLEVEARWPAAEPFSKVVVAQVLSAEKHPDADRLQVCKVDAGTEEPLQIVCGAPNARAGLKVACALIGAELPGISIKQAKVRGVESFGMLCSAKELGISEEGSGIIELPADAPVGKDLREYLELDDQIMVLKLTPNRSDCLSIIGIARDVAAITGAKLCNPKVTSAAVEIQDRKSVSVKAAEACPRYTGRMIKGVNAKAPSPEWMVRRLERCGLRSISAIVDITNYVLLEMGQPLHAFDADKLKGDIQVRMAKADEPIKLLNDETVELQSDMLVIADDQAAVALAGIMGGAGTAVSDDTVNVFLESAFFSPAAIIGKARRLGFSSDSSYRFERGVDFANTVTALERATNLILEICGGQVGPITEAASTLPERKPVKLRLDRLASVLGIPLDAAQVAGLFDQLSFDYTQQAGVFEVIPPSYRFDIRIEEDLIEEVARLHGYDNIPPIAPHADLQMLPLPEEKRDRNWLRDVLASRDYQEVVTYSFVDESWERDLLGNPEPIPLKNPIASDMSVMRTSLWGGLLDTLVYNLNRKQERARLFEVGAAYFRDGQTYREITRISGLAYGASAPEQWAQAARDVDFYDVKAEVDTLTSGRADYVPAQHPALHPGQTARVMLAGKAIGWLGKLHPKWQQHYDLPRGAILFELDAEPLLSHALPQYQELPKFPPVRRDLAVIVDEKVPVQAILDTVRNAKIPTLHGIALFDVYKGKGIAENKKSLAFLVLMQDTQKTLTDAEADEVMAKVLALMVQEHRAELRT